jgi:hypothetical protein
MGDTAVNELTSGRPTMFDNGISISGTIETSAVGRTASAFWMQALALLLWGFVYSFFWSSATIIYFLLRKSADGMPVDLVYVPGAGKTQGLPLVGIPAAERAAAERRAEEVLGADQSGEAGSAPRSE